MDYIKSATLIRAVPAILFGIAIAELRTIIQQLPAQEPTEDEKESNSIATIKWSIAEVDPRRYANKRVRVDGFLDMSPNPPYCLLWMDESSLKYYRSGRAIELNWSDVYALFKRRSDSDKWWQSTTGEFVEVTGRFQHELLDEPESDPYVGFITDIKSIRIPQVRRSRYQELFGDNENDQVSSKTGDPSSDAPNREPKHNQESTRVKEGENRAGGDKK